MPLQMRLPKVGFKSLNKIHYVPLNLEQIQAIHEKFGADTLTIEFLKEKGYLSRTDKVKILARGELSAKVSVSVHKISATAREAIEKAGGTVHLV